MKHMHFYLQVFHSRTPVKIAPLLTLLLFGALLGACTSKYTINVNAIVDTDAAETGKQYVFESSMQEVSENDLYFKEFSRYFARSLGNSGYSAAEDITSASVKIKFKYHVSGGHTGIRSFRVPIYEYDGGETIYITISTPTGPVTKTVRLQPRMRQVGSDVVTRSYTLFNRTASLKAVALDKEGKESSALWQIFLNSVSESDDLRQIMPYFAVVASDYLGKNTGQQKEIVLTENNPRVLEFKQLALPSQ